jgi:hypothetical protein
MRILDLCDLNEEPRIWLLLSHHPDRVTHWK